MLADKLNIEIMKTVTKKHIRSVTTIRKLKGVYPHLPQDSFDREFKCELNGNVYVSDNRRQYCRDDGVTQGTVIKNGKPLDGVLGWTKEHFVDSVYRYVNGKPQWKEHN
jgi:hypothetical protein